MTLTDTGNLGLGATPSAYGTRGFDIAGFVGLSQNSAGAAVLAFNNFQNGAGNYIYKTTNPAARYDCGLAGTAAHAWYIAASGTAGNTISFTQAMTLDASGQLLLGTTSAFNTSAGRANVSINGSSTAIYNLGVANASVGYLFHTGTDMWLNNVQNGILSFYTNNTERARITSGGYVLLGTSTVSSRSGDSTLQVKMTISNAIATFENSNAAPGGLDIYYSGAAPNGTGNGFWTCADTGATRAVMRSNGGLANYQANNVDLSDARTKKEITPASSMWDKIGALEIVTYKYNDQTHDDVNVGVIAQQVESVEPVWVDSDGLGETPEGEEPLKTVYTKDIYFAAIKALQEAMARIEQLETKVAALESK
jgi:hypothetical protein